MIAAGFFLVFIVGEAVGESLSEGDGMEVQQKQGDEQGQEGNGMGARDVKY